MGSRTDKTGKGVSNFALGPRGCGMDRLELFIAIWLAVLIGGFGYVLLLIMQAAAVN